MDDTRPLPCPAPLVFNAIGGKWKLSILQVLIFHGTHRFSELRRAIPGITQTMLTSQLRALEADGLVSRKVYAEVPPRVEYTATRSAMALVPAFEAMHDWWLNHGATRLDAGDGRGQQAATAKEP